MIEKLLKDINSILKKNENFFNSNPELFLAIKERFEKAIDDYDDDPWETANRNFGFLDDYPEDEYSDQSDADKDEDINYVDTQKDDEDYADDQDLYGESNLADTPEDMAQDEALQRLTQEQTPDEEKQAYADMMEQIKDQQPSNDEESMYGSDAEKDIVQPQQSSKKTRKNSWKISEGSYSPDQQKAILSFMQQGFSQRESVNLANAHKNFSQQEILSRRTPPDNPSELMLKLLKPHAERLFADKQSKLGLTANPENNPNMHLSAHASKIHSDSVKTENEFISNFRKEHKEKGLNARQIDKLLGPALRQWHADNPEHHQKKVEAADKVAQIAKDNKEQAGQKLFNARAAVVLANKASGGGDGPTGITGDVSNIAASGMAEAQRQGVGGIQEDDDGPTKANIKKDPASSMAKNPEFVRNLETSIVKKLDPNQLSRLKGVQAAKKKGGE